MTKKTSDSDAALLDVAVTTLSGLLHDIRSQAETGDAETAWNALERMGQLIEVLDRLDADTTRIQREITERCYAIKDTRPFQQQHLPAFSEIEALVAEWEADDDRPTPISDRLRTAPRLDDRSDSETLALWALIEASERSIKGGELSLDEAFAEADAAVQRCRAWSEAKRHLPRTQMRKPSWQNVKRRFATDNRIVMDPTMTLNETTLRDWFLVTFHDVPEGPNQVLWGTVADDPSCHWSPGDWCCTSPIIDRTADNLYVTKNTKYTLDGPGESVELPVKALIDLRDGVSPAEYQIMRDNPDLGLAFARQILASQEDIEAGHVEHYNIELSATADQRAKCNKSAKQAVKNIQKLKKHAVTDAELAELKNRGNEVSKQHVTTDNVPPAVLEYFEDCEQASRWWATPNLALGGQRPQDLTAEQLHDLLNRLLSGMTA